MNPTMTLFAAAALCFPLLACDKQQEAEYPDGGGAGYQSGYGAQHGGTAASTGAGTGGATSGTVGATHASPLPPGAAVLSSPILKGTAQSETAGMTEDGGAFGATFAEGQIHEHPFQIQPGRCYSVVGLGVGITELDVEIVVQQPPAPEWVAAVDGSSGPHAVLGGNGNCFKNPFPVGAPAKIRLKATGGSGVAVAQLYSR
jgi:hypothetical protein